MSAAIPRGISCERCGVPLEDPEEVFEDLGRRVCYSCRHLRPALLTLRGLANEAQRRLL